MKKLSILLVCCLLVGCSNKSEENTTTSIEETTQPTTIIETTTETTVNEDIIRLESEVAELESKVSELESKLAETSVETIAETTVEETTKETKSPKETVVVVITATPTPTEPTPTEPTTKTPKGEHVCECKSVTISLSTLDASDFQNYHKQVYQKISDAVTHKNCDCVLTPSGIPGIDFQLSPGTYTVTWSGECGSVQQTVIITD